MTRRRRRGGKPLEELDIFNSALHHRITRWSLKFPQPTIGNLSDMMWPASYTTEERASIKKFVHQDLNDHEDLWETDISEEDHISAVMNMKDDETSPVAMGKLNSVIQAVFLEVRQSRIDSRRSQSTASQRTSLAPSTATTSRIPSPKKGQGRGRKRSRGDDVGTQAS